MFDYHKDFSSKYDPKQRIWIGEDEQYFYERNLSIGEIIFEEMRRHPKSIAQISDSENTVLTKEALLLNAIRIATFLRNLDIGQTDIVGCIGRNTTHMAALAYACFFNGTAIHTLNPIYEKETCRKLLFITKPKIIFCDAQDYEKVQDAIKGLDAPIYLINQHSNAEIPNILDILKTPYDKKFRPSKLKNGNNQTLAILCSSGTTGTPKAVTIPNSHRIFSYFSTLNEQDVQYAPSTLDWLSGIFLVITSAVYGTTRLISENAFDPNTFLRFVEQYKITWTLLASGHLSWLLNCADLCAEKLDSLRYVIYGGCACTVETQKALKIYFRNANCQFGYGLTEFGSIATLHTDVNVDWKVGSVGQTLPGLKFKIIDDSGKLLEPKEVGEICCNTEQYWAGYYTNESETKQMKDAQGWIHSGDIGYFDVDNYLYIVDRKKDMLKYLNIMYYPNEIEEIITQIPDVAEVCVFGVQQDIVGDAAAAAVVKRTNSQLTAKEVIEFVRQKVSAKYKQLNGGAVILNELKKSPNGKPNRRAIKEECLGKLS